MIKKIVLGTILLIIIGTAYIGFDYFRESVIKFEFVDKIQLADSIENYPFIVSSNKKDLVICIEQIIDSSNVNIIKSLKFNFNEYDYLLSFCQSVKSMSYSKYYSDNHDFCSYIKEIPIHLHLNNHFDNNYVFIYRINEKNKYRHLCP